MTKKIITLPTNDSKIYKQILAFMNFILDITPQEREVLADLIQLNHEYEALPTERRAKFILSTDMRKEIRDKLDIEENQFNGIISRLKKKNYLGKPILDKNNIIHSELLFKPDAEGFHIDITLKITEKVKTTKVEKNNQDKVITEEQLEEEKKLAPPANGTDNVISSSIEPEGLLISPVVNEK